MTYQHGDWRKHRARAIARKRKRAADGRFGGDTSKNSAVVVRHAAPQPALASSESVADYYRRVT